MLVASGELETCLQLRDRTVVGTYRQYAEHQTSAHNSSLCPLKGQVKPIQLVQRAEYYQGFACCRYLAEAGARAKTDVAKLSSWSTRTLCNF